MKNRFTVRLVGPDLELHEEKSATTPEEAQGIAFELIEPKKKELGWKSMVSFDPGSGKNEIVIAQYATVVYLDFHVLGDLPEAA